MAIVDRHGLPLAVSIASASPHETKLVAATLEQRFVQETPQRMIGDRAYDSEKLDQHLLDHYATEMIAPPNVGRVNPPTQDGRPLRRYRRRWMVERFFAWLHNSRRLVTRWEYHAENFLAMLHLACALILLRHLSPFMRWLLVSSLQQDPLLAERIQRLRTVPGVGPITTLTWGLEMGDVSRFRSIRQAIVDRIVFSIFHRMNPQWKNHTLRVLHKQLDIT